MDADTTVFRFPGNNEHIPDGVSKSKWIIFFESNVINVKDIESTFTDLQLPEYVLVDVASLQTGQHPVGAFNAVIAALQTHARAPVNPQTFRIGVRVTTAQLRSPNVVKALQRPVLKQLVLTLSLLLVHKQEEQAPELHEELKQQYRYLGLPDIAYIFETDYETLKRDIMFSTSGWMLRSQSPVSDTSSDRQDRDGEF